jgi:hypothetical protein
MCGVAEGPKITTRREIDQMTEEMVDDKAVDLELEDDDLDRLKSAHPDEWDAIWREICERDGLHPSTVVWEGEKSFRARPVDQYTSIADIDAGWTFNDWVTGWGPGEKWRFTLNRRLTRVENNRVTTRIGQNETWDEETQQFDLDFTLDLMRRLCGDDLHVIRCRKELIEATEIKNGWEPVWPEPEDVEFSDGKIDQTPETA